MCFAIRYSWHDIYLNISHLTMNRIETTTKDEREGVCNFIWDSVNNCIIDKSDTDLRDEHKEMELGPSKLSHFLHSQVSLELVSIVRA